MDGLHTLYAHGHDGSSYRIRVLRRDRIVEIEGIASRRLQVYLTKAVRDHRVTLDAANKLMPHIRALALARKQIVDYSADLAGASVLLAQRNAKVIEDAVADVANHLPD